MRFAIATADKHEGVFHALMAHGWKPVKLFTFFDQQQCMGANVAAAASKLGVPVQTSRLTDEDLAGLQELDCEALVVANYRWRIGDWRPHLRYAVNFHPSPLPLGRGPWPLVRALREGLDEWGVSCHRLSADFDAGDLLAQARFAVAQDETQEGLDLRCQMALRDLAATVAEGFPALWRQAAPQGPADYWPRWSEADRALDLSGTVAQAQRQLRAFGLLECTARFGPSLVAVRRGVAWLQAHPHAPGTLVHGQGRHLVFALRDGYLGLLDWTFQAPAAAPAP
ncbi:MAG TPA: formyltransferase family protein [bacterium]|nr:formyltransferase family protein [bacterium]